jgi:gas vesicle protein
MEDMIQFIFGMVTMIGVAAIVTLVVGIVKVFKTSKQINNLWSSIDSQNTSIWQSHEDIRRIFEEDFRSVTARFDEVHRTINANFDEHERRIDQAIVELNDRIDDIDSSHSSETEEASREVTELIEDVTDALRDDINTLRDEIEEKARNSQSYIDSRFDKFEAKMTAEKAAKKVLKG